MKEVELKPCPFCGGEAKWESGSIKCGFCDLKFRKHGMSYEATNKAWNTRKPMEQIVKRLCIERPVLNLIRPDVAKVKEYNAYTRAIEIVKEVGG